eukprot:m.460214 g.460214  ORF g.460214 m.460214 type:complete len:513 (+) comp21968_c0_seq1:215-1753(+)
MAKGAYSIATVVGVGAVAALFVVLLAVSHFHHTQTHAADGSIRHARASRSSTGTSALEEMRLVVKDVEAEVARLRQLPPRNALQRPPADLVKVPPRNSNDDRSTTSQWQPLTYTQAHHGYNSHEKNAGGPLECSRTSDGTLHLRGTIQCEVNKVDCFATEDLFSVAEETQQVATLPDDCRPTSPVHVVASVWRVMWGNGVNRGKIDETRKVRLVLRKDGAVIADLTNGLDDWVLTLGGGTSTVAGEGVSARPRHPDVRVPPVPSATLTPPSRPMVAIGIPMTSRKLRLTAIESSPLFKVIPSLATSLPTDIKKFEVVLFAGYDDGDAFWSTKGPWPDRVISGIKVKFVQCPCKSMVCNTNCIMQRAYDAGALYFFRSNDDTMLAKGTDWISTFSDTLKTLDPPNLGVVGPDCGQGNTGILTHDFVHRTHMELFEGAYYPKTFTNWWCDDWISRTYGKRRTVQDTSVAVKHANRVQRYTVDYGVKQPGGPYDKELARSISIVRSYLHKLSSAK